jgi:hypothetical protein
LRIHRRGTQLSGFRTDVSVEADPRGGALHRGRARGPAGARPRAEAERPLEFREKFLNNLGFEPAGDTPEQFAAFLRQDRDIAAKKVKASGAKLD